MSTRQARLARTNTYYYYSSLHSFAGLALGGQPFLHEPCLPSPESDAEQETGSRPLRPLLLVLALLLAAIPVAARAACPITHPTVKVTTEKAPVAYDSSKDIAQLSRMPKSSRRADLKAYTHTLGVTYPTFDSHAQFRVVAAEDEDEGGWCATVQTADIRVFLQQTVFLARELKAGSCEHDLVLEHENKHVAVNETALDQVDFALKDAIRRARLPVSKGSSPQAAQKAAFDAMNRVIATAIKDFADKVRAEQDEIDAPREYDRLSHACGDGVVEELLAWARS
ncbi:MAG: hypothetical protein ACOY3L_12995 [Pseudomonadota bacterium]